MDTLVSFWLIAINKSNVMHFVVEYSEKDNTAVWSKLYSDALKFSNGLRAQEFRNVMLTERPDVYLVNTSELVDY